MSEEFSEFLEKMIEAEKAIVKSANDSVKDNKNFAVKTALKAISYDSLKHAEMYRTAKLLAAGKLPALKEKDLERQRIIVERHIRMEEDVIKELSKMIPQTKNEKIVFLLKLIIEDEKRHHKVLRGIQEVLVRGETVTEEDWWDVMWRDVPGLWA
jgi:rubrerythrin